MEWDVNYKLRHLTSQKYLSMGNMVENVNSESKYYNVKLVSNIMEASSFRFSFIYSTLSENNRENLLKYLQKDSFFYLKTV